MEDKRTQSRSYEPKSGQIQLKIQRDQMEQDDGELTLDDGSNVGTPKTISVQFESHKERRERLVGFIFEMLYSLYIFAQMRCFRADAIE